MTFTDVIQVGSGSDSVDRYKVQADIDDDEFPDVVSENFPSIIDDKKCNSTDAAGDDGVGVENVEVEEVNVPVSPEVDLPSVVLGRRNCQRERNQPLYLKDYDTTVDYVNDFVEELSYSDFCFRASVAVPKTYKQAVSCEESDKWKEAMDEEIASLRENNTYSLVPLPSDAKVVGGRWVYAVKTDPGGNERYKARYVAQGFKQIQGDDYFETFAPTAKMSSVRMVMQVAAELDLIVHQLDVKTAYLNAGIDCEIFMNEPKGYETSSGNVKMVCRLNKAIYGLKQSGRMWNIELNNFLKSHGFIQSVYDPCLYIYRVNSGVAFLLIWVDDIVVAADSDILLKKIKSWLKIRFKMKDLGVINRFLGIKFTVENGTITMDQTKYLENKLVKYKLDSCKTRKTPCELVDYDLKREDDGEIVDNKLYR